jgi:uncharacterized protein with PIN domain
MRCLECLAEINEIDDKIIMEGKHYHPTTKAYACTKYYEAYECPICSWKLIGNEIHDMGEKRYDLN